MKYLTSDYIDINALSTHCVVKAVTDNKKFYCYFMCSEQRFRSSGLSKLSPIRSMQEDDSSFRTSARRGLAEADFDMDFDRNGVSRTTTTKSSVRFIES